MKCLLDTNVCVDYLSGRHPQVTRRLQARRPGEICLSAIVEAELRYGIERSSRRRVNETRLDEFLAHFEVLTFDSRAARAYGAIRSALEASGTPIGPNDLLIAAQAQAHKLVLVTDNVSEFQRVAGLKVENWRTPR